MNTKRILNLALASALVAGGLVVGAGRAGATIGDVDPLFSCSDGSVADIGDVKVSPGLQTIERKNTITATFSLSGCSADEADLDEIAAESRFGVSKTIAGGRPTPVDNATAKAKFTSYGDCLGLFVPNDGDDTGEYPATYGTVQIQWRNGTNKVVKSTIFGTLALFPGVIDGIVTKGAGIGGTFAASVGVAPSALDDYNGSTISDFIECALGSDPTARGIYLDLLAPVSASITL